MLPHADAARLEQGVARSSRPGAEAAYVEVLARYLQAEEQAPGDASLVVERCEFVQRHADPESGRYLARTGADAEACERSLDALAESPEVLVYRFEQEWGDEARASGEALLARSTSWPVPLQRRIAAGLVERYRYADDGAERKDELLVAAAELDHGESTGPAAQLLAERGEYGAMRLVGYRRPGGRRLDRLRAGAGSAGDAGQRPGDTRAAAPHRGWPRDRAGTGGAGVLARRRRAGRQGRHGRRERL